MQKVATILQFTCSFSEADNGGVWWPIAANQKTTKATTTTKKYQDKK